MSWIFYAFLTVVSSIGLVLISKKVLNDEGDHDPIAYAGVSFLIVAVYASIFYAVTSYTPSDFKNLLNPSFIPILAFDFIAYAIAPSLYWRVLKKLPASEVQILYTLVGMFALFIATFVGTEVFHITWLLGGALILAAVALITKQEGKWNIGKYALLLIFSTVVYGAAVVADNYIITRQLFTIPFFEILQFGIPAILLFLINPKSPGKIGKMLRHKKVLLPLFVASFFFFLNYLFVFQAYKSGGAASQVNMFLAVETVAFVVFAAVFLKEREKLWLKIIASILATVGVILLSV